MGVGVRVRARVCNCACVHARFMGTRLRCPIAPVSPRREHM